MKSPSAALNATDFHVLLVLAAGELYGYAILKAVEKESGGAVRPEIGSLYRVLSRLTSAGFVREVEGTSAPQESTHPGRRRRYYGLTEDGRSVLEADAARLERAVAIARQRLTLASES